MIDPIREIISLCKKVNGNQRLVYYCTSVYKIYNRDNNKDYALTIPASVLLGSKISNYIVDINTLTNKKEEVIEVELDMCRVLDFDFNMEDIYLRLTHFIEKYKIPKIVAQYIWIFINDSVYINKVRDMDYIILACINLSYIVLNIERSNIEINSEVEEIMSEILEIYETNKAY